MHNYSNILCTSLNHALGLCMKNQNYILQEARKTIHWEYLSPKRTPSKIKIPVNKLLTGTSCSGGRNTTHYLKEKIKII